MKIGVPKETAVNERRVALTPEVAQRLIRSLTTSAPPRNRETEAQKAQERARQRYA